MSLIYENNVISVGKLASRFKEDKIMLLFGKESINRSIKEYSYLIDKVSAKETIRAGQKMLIGDKEYEITAVGDIAEKNLNEIQHITLKFDGSKTPEFPGTLYLEEKELPEISNGTKIKIWDNRKR